MPREETENRKEKKKWSDSGWGIFEKANAHTESCIHEAQSKHRVKLPKTAPRRIMLKLLKKRQT